LATSNRFKPPATVAAPPIEPYELAFESIASERENSIGEQQPIQAACGDPGAVDPALEVSFESLAVERGATSGNSSPFKPLAAVSAPPIQPLKFPLNPSPSSAEQHRGTVAHSSR
jgi:hypothetical protein